MTSSHAPDEILLPRIVLDPTRLETSAARVSDACREYGSFVIDAGDMVNRVTRRCFDAARQFHSLSDTEKAICAVDLSFANRGYMSLSGTDKTLSRRYATFDIGLELPDTDEDHQSGSLLLGPNLWPTLNGFREVVLEYYDASRAVGDSLADIFSVVLGAEAAFLRQRATKPCSQLRLLYYPGTEGEAEDDLELDVHTDYECFTLLQQSSAGLEVYCPEKKRWARPQAADGEIVVLVGDMLEIFSGGRLEATLHRVRDSGGERFSLAFFYGLDESTAVEPVSDYGAADDLPSFVTREHLTRMTVRNAPHLYEKYARGELNVPGGVPDENPMKRRRLRKIAEARQAQS